MRVVTEKERQEIWAEVRREFPGDEMMQALHFVRRLHGLHAEGMTVAARIAFYEAAREASAEEGRRRER